MYSSSSAFNCSMVLEWINKVISPTSIHKKRNTCILYQRFVILKNLYLQNKDTPVKLEKKSGVQENFVKSFWKLDVYCCTKRVLKPESIWVLIGDLRLPLVAALS